MNTPDLAPKDGDFVAYIEELERQQLLANPPASHAATQAAMNKSSIVTRPIVAPAAQSVLAAAGAVKSMPIGLIVIGLVLVIAGTIFQGGIIAIAIGIVLLWQAARTILRAARSATAAEKSQASQQIATLLAGHVQRKKASGK